MTLGSILGVDLQSIIPTCVPRFLPLENINKLTKEDIHKGL
jgi:hypothetical protein